MADKETENELPTTIAQQTAGTAAERFGQLLKRREEFGKKAYESANAIPAPIVDNRNVIELPKLTESIQVGYKNGQKTNITCCTVGRHIIEKNAAYDFILMMNAAAADGISLSIRSAFRSNEEQTALYEERKNPAIRKKKGAAAYPGYSNHQMGIALDINVNMSKLQFILKEYSRTFEWLQKYAGEFGYDHKEGALAEEPWHWTHLEAKIKGTAAFKSATGWSVLTTDTAVSAAASGQPGALRMANLEGHDETVAYARSDTMCRATRKTVQIERSIFSGYSSSHVSSRVAQLEAAKLTLALDVEGFDTTTLDPLTYNFKKGTWGDGRPV